MLNSPLDEKTLADLRATLGDDFIPELAAAYLEETPMLIKDLKGALADRNAQAFQRLAHSIKSSSINIGALDFSAKARALEMIGKSGDLGQAEEKLADLIGEYTELEQALKDFL